MCLRLPVYSQIFHNLRNRPKQRDSVSQQLWFSIGRDSQKSNHLITISCIICSKNANFSLIQQLLYIHPNNHIRFQLVLDRFVALINADLEQIFCYVGDFTYSCSYTCYETYIYFVIIEIPIFLSRKFAHPVRNCSLPQAINENRCQY